MSLFGDDVIFDDDDLEERADSAEQDDGPARLSNAGGKLAPPSHNTLMFGHEKQEKLFLDLFEKGTLPHAMIFSGPQGIGKTTMAYRLARFLLKHGKGEEEQDSLFAAQPLKFTSLEVESGDPVSMRVASGGHPDFRCIERAFDTDKGKQDSALKVETLRKIEPFLRMKSSDGGWRVVIVEDADTMNRNAQNAILKILEEPPSKVLLILVAHRPGALIPTIRSRARMIPFSPLEDTVMRDLLSKHGCYLEKDHMSLLLKMAEGRIGQAIRLAEEGGITILHDILSYLTNLQNLDMVRIHDLAQEISPAAQDKEYRLFTEMMQWVVRQILFDRARGQKSNPPLDAIMPDASLEKLVKISDELKTLFAKTDFSNLDRRDAVRGSFVVISQ